MTHHDNEQVRRAAMDRLGLLSNRKDYNLQRVVRVAAASLGCRYAAFSIPVGNQQVYISTIGMEPDIFRSGDVICHAVTDEGVPIVVNDVARSALWGQHGIRTRLPDVLSYCGYPVLSPDKQAIGTLCVMHNEPRTLNDENSRVIMNDLVRLVEDSLLLRGLAVRDPLTQLFNRSFFQEQIEQEWRRAMRLQLPLSLGLFDLDQFNGYNESVGEAVGDLALIRVSHLIDEHLRRAGDSVCRFGGDEFAVLMPITDAAAAVEMMDAIRREFEESELPNPAAGGAPLTISGGVATANSSEELSIHGSHVYMDWANDALNEAKQRGRNQICSYNLSLAEDEGTDDNESAADITPPDCELIPAVDPEALLRH